MCFHQLPAIDLTPSLGLSHLSALCQLSSQKNRDNARGSRDQILFVMTAELPGQDVLVPEMKCDSIKMCDLLKQATLFWSVWYWIYLLGTN